MALVSRGESNKDIARLIQMNIETIRSHIKKALIRMNVRGRIRANRKYLRIKGEIFNRDSDLNMLLGKIGLLD